MTCPMQGRAEPSSDRVSVYVETGRNKTGAEGSLTSTPAPAANVVCPHLYTSCADAQPFDPSGD